MEKLNFNFGTIDLDSINVSAIEKKTEKRKSIYKYSDEIEASADHKELKKKFRKTIRPASMKHALLVFKAIKENNVSAFNESKKSFLEFYTNNFLVNDFSFESFSQVSIKESPQEHSIYTIVLSALKQSEASEVKKEIKVIAKK
jgi:hypothetical protein